MQDESLKVRLTGVLINQWDKQKKNYFDHTFKSVAELEGFISYNRAYFETIQSVPVED